MATVNIPLTNSSKMAVVDEADLALVSQYKWSFSDRGYAITMVPTGRPSTGNGAHRRRLKMHILLMGKRPGFVNDHIDRDKLNNSRSNLRYATFAENAQNKTFRKDNTSGFRGVTQEGNKWVVQIAFENRRFKFSGYHDKISAAKAYDEKAKELHGEFALLNFPDAPPTPSQSNP